MERLYTRNEVERMIGVSRCQLEYWTRLRLVLPRSRWGERFFNFTDLVALQTIKDLAARSVPARRIRRAMVALEAGLGGATEPLSQLRISTNGRQLVVHSAAQAGRPFEPLTGQFVLNFTTSKLAGKVRAIAARSAEEWFEMGMACDSNEQSLEQAAEYYQQAVQAAPEWVEARINLGTALYQLDRMDQACREFQKAVELQPGNALAQFNLGCVLEQFGHTDAAVTHLLRAVEIAPDLADAHLNLALAYEKRGQVQDSVRHLTWYLRYEPQGPWAEFARSRVSRYRSAPSSGAGAGKLTPFRRRPRTGN